MFIILAPKKVFFETILLKDAEKWSHDQDKQSSECAVCLSDFKLAIEMNFHFGIIVHFKIKFSFVGLLNLWRMFPYFSE